MPQVWYVRLDETPEMKRRNDVEAIAVVAYLAEKSSRDPYPRPPGGVLGAGRKLFETIGCMGCHRVGDDRADDRELDPRPFERRSAVYAQGLDQHVAAGGQREADPDRHVPTLTAALEIEGRTRPAEGPAGMGYDEAAEDFFETRGGGIRHGWATQERPRL